MGTSNNAVLLGRLGRDPETRFTNSGKAVCNFSVATDRKSGGEDVTDWHNITCWDKTAEIAQKFLSKGSEVMVQGEIRYSTYKAKDGTEKNKTEINCTRITLIGKKGSADSSGGGGFGGTEEKAEMPF